MAYRNWSEEQRAEIARLLVHERRDGTRLRGNYPTLEIECEVFVAARSSAVLDRLVERLAPRTTHWLIEQTGPDLPGKLGFKERRMYARGFERDRNDVSWVTGDLARLFTYAARRVNPSDHAELLLRIGTEYYAGPVREC